MRLIPAIIIFALGFATAQLTRDHKYPFARVEATPAPTPTPWPNYDNPLHRPAHSQKAMANF